METEIVQERTTFEASSLPEDREEIPETFPGHEALPSVCIHLLVYANFYYYHIQKSYKKLFVLGLGTNNCSRWTKATTPITNARNNKRWCSNT